MSRQICVNFVGSDEASVKVLRALNARIALPPLQLLKCPLSAGTVTRGPLCRNQELDVA